MATFSLIILVFCVNYSLVDAKALKASEENVDRVFHRYIKRYSKTYANDIEHQTRKAIFLENWKMIEHHNRQNLSYTMSLNEFADRTTDELTVGSTLLEPAELQGYVPFPYTPEQIKKLAKTLPKNFDMRREKYLSSVKNQGDCGSCWAFAAAGAVEATLARQRGGQPVDLSEQALVDCVPANSDHSDPGCTGNFRKNAFEYMMKYGVPIEEEYPYKHINGTCRDKFMVRTTKIEGYTQPTPKDPDALKVALYYHGPVTAGVYASENMKFYKKGVFIDPECNTHSINHGVLVVGYGTREVDGVNYWILKNSYGIKWGMKGYALIATNDDNCFVLLSPFYPIV